MNTDFFPAEMGKSSWETTKEFNRFIIHGLGKS